MNLQFVFEGSKAASITLAELSDERINAVLRDVADAAIAQTPTILAANEEDLARMDKENPMYDRLRLTSERIEGIAADTRKVATLPSPLGRTLSHTVLPNGLDISRVSVPFGVIGIVYEARPNVTFDVFALCLKSGNACVLKGGSDASASNRAIVALIQQVLRQHDLDPHIVQLLPPSHEATAELLHANGWVDVVIPRGSRRLIDFVRNEASVPVIETGAGVCHAFFDRDGDLEKGKRIVCNAKTRRVSVCNALDCLIIDAERLADLPALVQPMAESRVKIFADEPAFAALKSADTSKGSPAYPAALVWPATEESFGTEFQDYVMAIRTVANADEAIAHIRCFGSGHSECIITENQQTANRFLATVDAACVYHNAPTSFTDGAQFGLGAEIGISTQKLHARGPMALEAMTTYKWIIRGNGQVRPK